MEVHQTITGDPVQTSVKIFINVETELFATDLIFPCGVPVNGLVSLVVGNFEQKNVCDSEKPDDGAIPAKTKRCISKQRLIITAAHSNGMPACIPKPCDEEYNVEMFWQYVAPKDDTVTLSAGHLKKTQSPACSDSECDVTEEPLLAIDNAIVSGSAELPQMTQTRRLSLVFSDVSDCESVKLEEESDGNENPSSEKEHRCEEDGDSLFVCALCDKGFSCRALCRKHVWQHIPPVHYTVKCPNCGNNFKSRMFHDKRGEVCGDCQNNRHRCSVCSKGFPLVASLEKHMRTHADHIYVYCCEYCGWMSISRWFYSLHVKNKHKDASQAPATNVEGTETSFRRPCTLCSFAGNSEISLSKHYREQHQGASSLFPCTFCSLIFVEDSEREKHTHGTHRILLETKDSKVYYVCQVCGKEIASSLSTYSKHMSLHENGYRFPNRQDPHEKNFLCSRCGIRVKSSKSLRQHMLTHDQRQKVHCPQCNGIYIDTIHLQRHVERVHNPRFLHCNYCSMKFKTVALHKKHLFQTHLTQLTDKERRYISGLKKYTCELCSHTTFRRKMMESHAACHAGLRPFSCTHCQKAFSNKLNLRQHIASAHLHQGGRCKFCRRLFLKDDSLQNHLAMHLDHTGHICQYCNKLFESGEKLSCHVLTCPYQLPRGNYGCDVCGKVFPLESSLAVHKRSAHRILKGPPLAEEMVCNTCGKTFMSAANLEAHKIYQHGGHVEAFPCSYCDTKCMTETELVDHMQLHFSEKPYRCRYCEKYFALCKSLRAHEAQHVKQFSCSICDEQFTMQSELNDHFQALHTILHAELLEGVTAEEVVA